MILQLPRGAELHQPGHRERHPAQFMRLLACCKNEEKLPKATPALAKAVWESQKKPSVRSVARAMNAAGYPVHFTTVRRWRANGWPEDGIDDHPLETAVAKLESIAPLVSDKPTAETQVSNGEGTSKLNQEELSDAQLLKRAVRQVLISMIQIESALHQQIGTLVKKRPSELAFLIQALGQCSQLAWHALLQAECMEEPSSSAQAPLQETTLSRKE